MFGWGTMFHFAPRAPGESLDDSLRRYEYYLSTQLGIKPGMKILDVGCGIGGPMQKYVVCQFRSTATQSPIPIH